MDSLKGSTSGTREPGSVSTKRQRIATLAQRTPKISFTSLAYHMDIEWLREAYRRTRKDGACGIDGQTAADYAGRLEDSLKLLLERAKSGLYRAPAVRRVHIPKGTDGTRPLGIPTFEDKVLQRAVVMILEEVYEQDFLDCSYGFRPGRSAHDALQSLWQHATHANGGVILEVDIEKFFDTLDHGHLREFIKRRVRDGVLIRLIGKWLNAGVLHDGCWTRSTRGTPQGGVISPLLANIYMHYVLDEWFEQEVKPRMSGNTYLVRYADDFVIGFTHQADAQRVLDVLPKRLAKYGLKINTDKTRLVPFDKPPRPHKGKGPGAFAFLGFTHYWAKSHRGSWVIRRKTESCRFHRALSAIAKWCRENRHLKIREQHRILRQKIQGHYSYYGITSNGAMLTSFWEGCKRIWKNWLTRRSRKAYRDWEWFVRMLETYPLPKPVVVHSAYRQKRNHNLRSRMR